MDPANGVKTWQYFYQLYQYFSISKSTILVAMISILTEFIYFCTSSSSFQLVLASTSILVSLLQQFSTILPSLILASGSSYFQLATTTQVVEVKVIVVAVTNITKQPTSYYYVLFVLLLVILQIYIPKQLDWPIPGFRFDFQ